MGLEEEGQCLFEGAVTTVSPAIVNSKVIHGLKAKEDIKKVEEGYGQPFTNLAFWANISIPVSHTLDPVDPDSPQHILKMGVLSASGKLAPSVQDEADPNRFYQFVLEDPDAEKELKMSLYDKRHDAIYKMRQIKDKEPGYLIALCSYICNFNSGEKKVSGAALKLGEFIEGKLSKNSNDAVDYFLQILDPAYGGTKPKEEVIVRVEVEKAIHLGVIKKDRQKQIYYNGAMVDSDYGRTPDEVVSYLLAVSNADHLGGGQKDEPYAIRRQIAQIESGK
jgi:hypothetical protein